MTTFPTVKIRDENIRLGQFIKLANLVETGGEAKEFIAAGMVLVNGTVDTRRGKVLHPGDEVALLDAPNGTPVAGAVVSSAAANAPGANPTADLNTDPTADPDDDLGDYFDEATANDDFDPEKWRNL